MNRIKVMFDKLLLDNWYRIPFMSYETTFKYDFPTKRLVKYCFQNYDKNVIEGKVSRVAHMYAFDSTVTKEDLSLIHLVYGTSTRERVRQILCKFIRPDYTRS